MGDIDPSLGISANFPSDDFTSAIRFAMQMGAPPDEALRVTFVFASTGRTYRKGTTVLAETDVRLDRSGEPLDPEVTWTETPPRRAQVDCAIEIERADANELPVGNFRPTKATVTVLDEQHEQVKGCREIVYNGDRYLFGYEPDALGMFSVGVFTMIFYALDES